MNLSSSCSSSAQGAGDCRTFIVALQQPSLFHRIARRSKSFVLLSAAAFSLALAAPATSASDVPPPRTPLAIGGYVSPAGLTYSYIGLPVLDSAGQVAFSAGLVDKDGNSSSAIFVGQPGALQAFTTVAPNFGSPNGVLMNASGVIATSARHTDTSADAYFVGLPGSTQELARAGMLSPAGSNYSFFQPDSMSLSSSGQAAFWAYLQGSYPANSGIFLGTPGAVTPVVVGGDAAPGVGILESPGSYFGFNGAGQVLFTANINTLGDYTAGLFLRTTSSIQTVMRTGTAAPAGGNLNYPNNFTMNSSGLVAFQSELTGGSSTGGIFLGTPGALQTVALQQTAAPSGGNFRGLSDLVLNDAGQVAFRSSLEGGTATSGIFVGKPGALQTIILQGDTTPFGGTFDYFYNMVMNGAGQVAFAGDFSGPGLNFENNGALFVSTNGTLVPIVREGEWIDVDPGVGEDLRQVANFGINVQPFTSADFGRGSSFSDDGLLVYNLYFTDGTSANFATQITAVPEPGTIALLAVGTLGLFAWRRQRRVGSV